MIVSLSSRGVGAAALAAGLLLAGCSSDSDVPKTVASAPNGGTQINTDTGSGGNFPDVNSVPTQRPTSTIQDLNQAPQGLSGAQSGTQYGEPLVGGPSSSAAPPPPPPEPTPQEDLAPIPEPGVKTQTSDSQSAPAPEPTQTAEAPAPEQPAEDAADPSSDPIPTPEVAEPQAGMTQPAPQVAETAPAPGGGVVQTAPMPAAPQQPAAPVGTPQEGSRPFQPEDQLALAPGSVQTPGLGATQQAALPSSAYGPNYAALAPENYGIAFPTPALPPYQAYNPAQAMYRSPYASPPTNYGGANDGTVVMPGQSSMVAPTYASYGQTYYGGQPVGLIYFGDGSARLSSDDRSVLKQIAEMQRTYGGMVHVVGHASMHTGTMDFAAHQKANQRISEARANAVARQLMKYGVPREAIQAAAAGDAQPLYSEVMPSGEAANRRAEVYLGAY